jgi:micrococcal nuclease
MKKYLLMFLIISFSIFTSPIISKEKPNFGNIRVSKVLYVHDGDTFKVNIDEYPPIIGEKISIRVARIDTPEITSKDPSIKKKALLAKSFTENFLKNSKEIVLKNIRRDKYFRIVADVIVDNKDLSAELIKNGLALPYDGKKKLDWSNQ